MYCQNCGTEMWYKNGQTVCPKCGAVASPDSQQPTTQQQTPTATQNPFYKKWWFWVIIAIVLLLAIIGFSNGGDTSDDISNTSKVAITQTSGETNSTSEKTKVTVVDFSAMSETEIEKWAETNNVRCVVTTIYSDTVPAGNIIEQSEQANSTVSEGDIIYVKFSKGKKPSVEYQNALVKAESYSKTMHMSKKGIYDQLTSEYGEGFSADAAQYAIDNLQADYKANALAKAKSYQENMHMSKNAIYEQLISEYGEQFTKEEAQYAIDHLND